jgi:hypothetical protein
MFGGGHISSAAEEVVGRLVSGARSMPQALKRGHFFSGLAARVELLPFPMSNEAEQRSNEAEQMKGSNR